MLECIYLHVNIDRFYFVHMQSLFILCLSFGYAFSNVAHFPIFHNGGIKAIFLYVFILCYQHEILNFVKYLFIIFIRLNHLAKIYEITLVI